jgi:hypothetical protein
MQSAKNPANWMEIPLEIGVRWLKYLDSKDIIKMHLVCRKFHEIAKFYHHRLKLDSKFAAHVLQKSTRIYEEIEINCEDEEMLNKEQLTAIGQLFTNNEFHIKKLDVQDMRISEDDLIHFLKLLPNLQTANFSGIETLDPETDMVYQKIKLSKLEELSITSCDANFEETLLKSLESSSIQKLTIGSVLKLESSSDHRRRSLKYKRKKMDVNESLVNFLKKQNHLKILKTKWSRISDQTFNVICGTCQNLETLQIGHGEQNFQGLEEVSVGNIKKLESLKKLVLNECRSLRFNPLIGLIGSINPNLQDLEASFQNISPATITELSRLIPNLRKLTMQLYPLENLDCLKGFQNLEELTAEIRYFNYNSPDEIIFSCDRDIFWNVKYLSIHENFWVITADTAKQITHNFPNLEELNLTKFWSMADECIEIFLRDLKQLKVFKSDDNGDTKMSRKIVEYIKVYGKNLEKLHISTVDFKSNFVQEELKHLRGLKFSCTNFDIVI